MLEYKAAWYERQIVFVPQDYASSKLYSYCGTKYEKLSSQASWKCTVCGTRHDRDINAAMLQRCAELIQANVSKTNTSFNIRI